MSDTMLLGVLRMPFDLAMATLTAQIQYHQRGVQAADEIEKRTRERDEARAEVDRLRAEIERMQAEMPVAKSLETAVTCLTIERDKARSVVAGQAREIADLRAEVERLYKEHEVACMGGELLRDEIKRLLAVEAAHKQLQATLNAADFVVEKEDGR